MKIEISQPRRDGKYPVTLTFAGAPNMFGGFYPGRVFRKLYTLEKVKETVAKHGTDEQKARFKKCENSMMSGLAATPTEFMDTTTMNKTETIEAVIGHKVEEIEAKNTEDLSLCELIALMAIQEGTNESKNH